MIPQSAHVAKALEPLLNNDDWVMEEKFDGDRYLLVYKDCDRPRAYTRQGNEALVPRIKTARHTLEFFPADSFHVGTTILDGEILATGEFKIFDMPMCMDLETHKLTYDKRRAMLEKVFPLWKQPGFELVDVERGGQKELIAQRLFSRQHEGLMFKRRDSIYKFDHRTYNWLKWKFYKTGSVIITEMQREGKPEAATICVYDGDDLVEVSGVKIPTIYQEQQNIQQGDIIEVRFLKVTEGGKLREPVFLKKRTDVDPTECTIEKLNEAN